MDNYIVKKVLFCGAILLWVASASYGCGNGPCSTSSACGGIGGGMGTCRFEGGHCVGKCPSHCPTGDPDKFCLGIVGDCTITMTRCSSKETYACMVLGDMDDCGCIFAGYSGNCPRQDC
jgi:hypothetical protein